MYLYSYQVYKGYMGRFQGRKATRLLRKKIFPTAPPRLFNSLCIPNTKDVLCFMGILATPPKATPSRNKGLIRPYFLRGVALGGQLGFP